MVCTTIGQDNYCNYLLLIRKCFRSKELMGLTSGAAIIKHLRHALSQLGIEGKLWLHGRDIPANNGCGGDKQEDQRWRNAKRSESSASSQLNVPVSGMCIKCVHSPLMMLSCAI